MKNALQETFRGIAPLEMILFLVFGAVHVGLQQWWLFSFALNPGEILPFFADASALSTSNLVLNIEIAVVSLVYAVAANVVVGGDKPISRFLVRIGVALSIYGLVGQVVSLFVPFMSWTSPDRGIPVMQAYFLATFFGLILAGIGSNGLWSDKREEFIAATSKKRR